ncbi:MAG: Slp family lipoprotein [Chromatiales bacterium]|jgi:outer membrane lipoprotein
MIFPRISILLSLIAGLALTGCASPIPDLIKNAPPNDIRVEEVQQKPNAFIGAQVRWGGDIIRVENLERTTMIEVLSRRLFADGKPDAGSSSEGRFKIAVPGFVEPTRFPKDRRITVRGRVAQVVKGKVGAYQYPYPVVEPDAYYLWPKEVVYRYGDVYGPYYYPWSPWSPWYPYYPYWWRGYPYYYW